MELVQSAVDQLLSIPHLSYVVCGAATIGVIAATVYYVKKRKDESVHAARRAAYPRDTVILHQLSRGPYAPSVSPFPIKLETFLRIAKVPYQSECALEMSSKGKIPWITLNGRDIADTEFSMMEIKKHFKVDIEDHLTAEQQAHAHALKKWTDEAFVWLLAMIRWVHEFESQKDFMVSTFAGALPLFMVKKLCVEIHKQAKAAAHAQGMGRHTVSEIQTFIAKDLEAYSQFLGDKDFMLGDKPTEADCSVFGQLSQVKWHLPDSSMERKFKEYPNLDAYCERMKERYWPDWDQCNTAGGTKEAEK